MASVRLSRQTTVKMVFSMIIFYVFFLFDSEKVNDQLFIVCEYRTNYVEPADFFLNSAKYPTKLFIKIN